MSDEPGRNDPCPCGSGRKYKNCCQGETTGLSSSTWKGVLIALAVIAGLVLIGLSFSSSDSTPDCPPGQVWSEAHGHCH